MSKRGLSREEKRTRRQFPIHPKLTAVVEIFHESVRTFFTCPIFLAA